MNLYNSLVLFFSTSVKIYKCSIWIKSAYYKYVLFPPTPPSAHIFSFTLSFIRINSVLIYLYLKHLH